MPIIDTKRLNATAALAQPGKLNLGILECGELGLDGGTTGEGCILATGWLGTKAANCGGVCAITEAVGVKIEPATGMAAGELIVALTGNTSDGPYSRDSSAPISLSLVIGTGAISCPTWLAVCGCKAGAVATGAGSGSLWTGIEAGISASA